MTIESPARNVAEMALGIQGLLIECGGAQWQAGRTPTPREDTTERSRNMVSDPTPSIVADGRRLELRAAVIAAQAAILEAHEILGQAGTNLQAAVDRWHGEARK